MQFHGYQMQAVADKKIWGQIASPDYATFAAVGVKLWRILPTGAAQRRATAQRLGK